MKRKTLLLCGLVVSAAAGAMQSGCDSTPPRTEPPPPKVTVAKPELRQVVDSDKYNGWLRAAETVEIRARVRGHLDKINFVDGDLVKKGQLLFELDPRPFQADIERAKDQVKIYEAQQVAAAKEDARLKELVKKGGASQSQVDAAEAETISLDAQIQATKQEVTRKELDLEYSKITAPIAGRIGRAMMTVGNLVNAGGSDPVLATIVSVDPIYVYFDVDERALQRYAKSRTGTTSRPLRELKMNFTFGLDSDEGYPHAGVLDFADNRIDSQTGTIEVRGVVPNPGTQFVAGSRVRIRVPIGEEHAVLLVPDTAVLTDQDKRYVLVLDDKNVVQRRDVELGKLLDDGNRVVLPAAGGKGGITADDRIITQGIQAARINYPVEPIASTTQPPASSPSPSPTTAAAAPGAPATAPAAH